MFSSVNFFTPKLIKIRWSFHFLGSFAHHFQTRLSIHGLNCNFRFVSMNELELFLLTRVLTPNFNIVDLVKILEKNQKLHIQIVTVTLKVTSYKTMSKKNVKKSKKPRLYRQNKLFFGNPALQPLGSFSHMAACRSSLENTRKNELNTCFQQKNCHGLIRSWDWTCLVFTESL
jgi:hypothetical protein